MNDNSKIIFLLDLDLDDADLGHDLHLRPFFRGPAGKRHIGQKWKYLKS